MNKKDNIILIGFMGCGKTTFGKWIAANKNRKFFDTDELIEKENKMTISDIFAKNGELYFRKLETQMLKNLIDKDTTKSVISVGGGLPVKEENQKLLGTLGTVVYLCADTDELVRRLKKDNTRPLLAGGDLRTKINGLMEARKDIYEKTSDIMLDTQAGGFDDMYRQIEEFLRGNL